MKTPTRSDKPDWWLALEDRFSEFSTADLPPVPWTLLSTAPGVSMHPLGGPFAKVIDNDKFLKHLKADLAAGPGGPRGHVIVNDLEDLKASLEKTSAHHGSAAEN